MGGEQDIDQNQEESKEEIKQDVVGTPEPKMSQTATSGFGQQLAPLSTDLESRSEFRKTTESFQGVKPGTTLAATKQLNEGGGQIRSITSAAEAKRRLI